MPRKTVREQNAFLYDMLESARVIRGYVAGVTFEAFWENREKRDAVAMRIAAIGDAARHVTKATESAVPAVPFHNICGMRNRLAHDYGQVDFREVWSVAQQDIEPLIAALEDYFARHKAAES